MAFDGFTDSDFDTYKPDHRTSAKYTLARRLVKDEEIERAARLPPQGTPAFTRGRFIRGREPSLSPVRISWDSARIGGRLHGRVVRFPVEGGDT